MPELPEVETIRRGLIKKTKGKKISKVEIRLSKIVNFLDKHFKEKTQGAKVENIRRRAKLLIIELSNKYSILVHLKLTGQLIFNGPIEKHSHVVFYFSDKSRLVFNDLRQFGYLKIMKNEEVKEFSVIKDFGPEPLAKSFTLKKFKDLLSRRKKAKIKPLLMDQNFIAGIGNIYAQEACFYAKILPTRTASSLSGKEIEELYKAIKKVLLGGIKYRGTSVDAYVDSTGKKGEYEKRLKVYGRQKKPCFKCKTEIKTMKLGSRGTAFCPKCQK